jgi:16S rRNA G966 N2-methylase RsmD
MYNGKKIRLFPYLKDKNKLCNLKIDDESIDYITSRDDANIMTNMIKQHLASYDLDVSKMSITDSTAGVGGNTLSFGQHFMHVNAIEINEQRCKYMQNNISVYDLDNITIYNDDCTKRLKTMKQDIIFIDPPWGGKMYKFKEKIRINIGNKSIEQLCNELIHADVEHKPKLIVLKLPTNYDWVHFEKIIKKKVYMHDLKKIILLIIDNFDNK